MKHGWIAASALLAVLAPAARASAQVSCADPDNLCTGDPCTTGDIEVVSPCVLDFSPRTLIIGNTLLVPDGGTLSFTAGAIQVNGRIIARGQNGASVSLTSAGILALNKGINATGRNSAGTIALQAGGDLTISALLKAGGPTASGGTVTAESTGGTLTTEGGGRIMVRSRTTETGGSAILRGAVEASIAGRILADGGSGGTIEVSSSSGHVAIQKRMRSRGKAGVGGQIAIRAGAASGIATIDAKVEAPGSSGGGDIEISGSSVLLNQKVRARGLPAGNGGNIELSGGSFVQVNDRIDVRGYSGGTITVGAAAGTTQTIVVLDNLDADGKTAGGKIEFGATGSVTVGDGVRVDTHGKTAGGCIRVTGADVTTGPRTDFTAGANHPSPGSQGEMRFLATAGDMTLADDLNVEDDGIIDAFASGDLVAVGDFEADQTGCVGLDAGGTLETSGADIHPALSSDCPGTGACSLF